MYVYFILFLDRVPIAQACLELNYVAEDNQTSDLPPLPPKWWDYRCVLPRSVHAVLGLNPGLCEC